MHKLLHRVHSNPKDSTSDKKKKRGTKSNVKNALKSTIAAPLALSHSKVKSDTPNENIPSAASSEQNDKTSGDFYSMASEEVMPTSKENEIEEDVYENTDVVLAEGPNCSEKHHSMPQKVPMSDNQSNTPESLYDMADSFAGGTTPVKSESVEDQSDTDTDDIYSHLATEPSTNDQLYDRLERNLSDTSDTVYNCLGDHEISNPNPDTGPNFRANVYEDVDMLIDQTDIASNQAPRPRTKSHLSQDDDDDDDDDTYEDVSFPLPVKAPVPSTSDENDGTDKEPDDDTYEDVSNLPIQRFREPQPLPPRSNPKLNMRPSSIHVESTSPNVPPPRQTLAPPNVPPQKHDTELKPTSVANEAKHSFKHSKSKHPSQWFTKPFLKPKPKLELRKRADSKQNTLNFDENPPPVSPTEPRPIDANIRSRARLPTPQGQDRLTSPTQTHIAGSLEESALYRTMQEKLRTPENE